MYNLEHLSTLHITHETLSVSAIHTACDQTLEMVVTWEQI